VTYKCTYTLKVVKIDIYVQEPILLLTYSYSASVVVGKDVLKTGKYFFYLNTGYAGVVTHDLM
jgi:hypothetical protein